MNLCSFIYQYNYLKEKIIDIDDEQPEEIFIGLVVVISVYTHSISSLTHPCVFLCKEDP